MSNSNMVLNGWEERVISREKGNQYVQYRVVDSKGNSLLAVVGRERGQRHMTYTVKRDFLCVCVPVSKVPARTRWTSRKSVVEFLSSITSAVGPILADSKGQKIELTTHPKRTWMARFSSEDFTQPAAEGGGLHQAKKARFAHILALRDPQSSSKAEGSQMVALKSLGPSASEGDTKATSSATVGYNPRRIAGVELSRPNGSSADSGISFKDAVKDLKAGTQRVPKSNNRRA